MTNSILLTDNFYARKSLEESNGDCVYDIRGQNLNEIAFTIYVQTNGNMYIKFFNKRLELEKSIRLLNKFSEYLFLQGITPRLKILKQYPLLQKICRKAGYRQKGTIFTFKGIQEPSAEL